MHASSRRRQACRARPGPEGAAEGRSAGLGIHGLLSMLPPPTSGLARRPGDDGGVRGWTGNCLVLLSPTTSGQARRGRRRGGQPELDGESAFYASRRRLRAWPGGGGGVRSWTGNSFARRLSLPTSGLARRGRQRGALLDGDVSFYGSRRRLRAWPGGGGRRGALPCSRQAEAGPGPKPQDSDDAARLGWGRKTRMGSQVWRKTRIRRPSAACRDPEVHLEPARATAGHAAGARAATRVRLGAVLSRRA